MSDGPAGVVLHTSWRGRSAMFGSPLISLGLAVWAVVGAGGLTAFAVVLFLIGCALFVVALFDYPISTSFDHDAIIRRCLFRHARLEWDDVDEVARARSSRLSGWLGSRPGLLARLGRRPHLLCDTMESAAEHRALVALIESVDPAIHVSAPEPPEGGPPTWLYKRKVDAIGPGAVDVGATPPRQLPD